MKKLIKYFVTLVILSAVISLGVSKDVEASGWNKTDNGWQFLDGDGNPSKNRWLYDTCWYYFDENGYMSKGLKTITNSLGKTYTYYFNPSKVGSYKEGRMMTGWQYINGSYMYFNTNGEHVDNNKHEAGSIKGIDVSQYQGNMDWSAVKNQGISFTFIRIGHGNHKIDPYFKQNITNANAVGIHTGVYFYSTAKSVEESKADAQWVIQQVQGYNVSYPIAIDMEDNSQTSLGKQTLTDMTRAFCDEISSAGYTPIVYCNENWAKNFIDFGQLSGYYKWIARYNGTYNENISRNIWQAGSTTLLAGITVNSVDIDFCYTDFTKIVTPRTAYAEGYSFKNGKWQKSDSGWWLDYGDGTYAKDQWIKDNGKWYYFNENGYIQNGWVKSGSSWYYMTESGALENTWRQEGNVWYYFLNGGKMATGWQKADNKWYYFFGDGIMMVGWLNDGGTWYYLTGNGMCDYEWKEIDKKWYYFGSGGPMATGWKEVNGKWYYFNADGSMAANTTIDGYTLNADGVWVP